MIMTWVEGHRERIRKEKEETIKKQNLLNEKTKMKSEACLKAAKEFQSTINLDGFNTIIGKIVTKLRADSYKPTTVSIEVPLNESRAKILAIVEFYCNPNYTGIKVDARMMLYSLTGSTINESWLNYDEEQFANHILSMESTK